MKDRLCLKLFRQVQLFEMLFYVSFICGLRRSVMSSAPKDWVIDALEVYHRVVAEKGLSQSLNINMSTDTTVWCP